MPDVRQLRQYLPSGINHPERYIRMREQMIRDHGDRPEIKSLVYLLAKESRIRMAAGAAKMARKTCT